MNTKQGSIPAIAVLLIAALTLVIFGVIDRMNIKPAVTTTTVSTATSTTAGSATGQFNDTLARVIAATKKAPFKARIVTETGFKGYWTQSGNNYRFEDPAKQNIIIFNATKHAAWVVNMPGKVAMETLVATSSASSYVELSPAFFVAGFSDTSTAGTKSLEDLLPSATSSQLIFTRQGLPQSWIGTRKNGTRCEVKWEYMQINGISPTEFELPQGLSVTRTKEESISAGHSPRAN